MDWILAPVMTRAPFASAAAFRNRDPVSSSCRPMRDGAISTIVTLRPVFRNSEAASRPSTPPPIMTMSVTPGSMFWIAMMSVTLRITRTMGWSAPGIGGTKLSAPVAQTKRS